MQPLLYPLYPFFIYYYYGPNCAILVIVRFF